MYLSCNSQSLRTSAQKKRNKVIKLTKEIETKAKKEAEKEKNRPKTLIVLHSSSFLWSSMI